MRLRVCGTAWLLGLAITGAAQAQSLWGDLRPGPHAAGFTLHVLQDASRPALQDSLGTVVPTGVRELRVGLWYPAVGGAGTGLQLHDVMTADLRGDGDAATRLLNAATLHGGPGALAERLDAVLAQPLRAVRDAAAAQGSFPLLILAGEPWQYALLGEYLATHGIMVAAFPLQGTHTEEFDVGDAGVATIAADYAFVLGALRARTQPASVALLGLGITASGALIEAMRNPAVQAYVSLDGGITTPFEDQILRRSPYYDVPALRVPMLVIHAPHPNVDPVFVEAYRYAPRRLLHFPGMTEFHFQIFGALDELAPGIIGAAPGNAAIGHRTALQAVRLFVEAELKGEAAAGAQLAAFEASAPDGVVRASVMAAMPPAPTLVEARAHIRREGMPAFVAHIRALARTNPQPLTAAAFSSMVGWAGWALPEPAAARAAIAELWSEIYPASARAQANYGVAVLTLGDRSSACTALTRAAELLPDDADPTLTAAARTSLTNSIATNRTRACG